MRIGVDATCWANDRGFGRYTRELVAAMAVEAPQHELICLLDPASAGKFALNAPNVTPVAVPQSGATAATTGNRRSIADMLRFTAATRAARLDAFYSPSVYGYFPIPPGLPAVVTVHDAIAERFPALTLPGWKDRLAWRAKMRLALAQARLVLTVSDYAAREITSHLGVPPGKLRVTLEGVADAFQPAQCEEQIRAAAARARIPDNARWLMYVGGFGPHKHVDVLARAHAAIAKRHRDRPLILVLVGHYSDGFHSDIAGIREVIKASGTEHLVRWAGFLPDSEVRLLHSGALALVMASASEGFGLPAVEAARCGIPVIATTESPLPELLEGGGVFVPPADVEALTAAIEKICTDEAGRLEMGATALKRASVLSWNRAARVAIAALEEVASVAEKVESNAHART